MVVPTAGRVGWFPSRSMIFQELSPVLKVQIGNRAQLFCFIEDRPVLYRSTSHNVIESAYTQLILHDHNGRPRVNRLVAADLTVFAGIPESGGIIPGVVLVHTYS